MNLDCERCGNAFEVVSFRGYCDGCLEFFAGERERVHAFHHPAPGVHASGKVGNLEIPHSFPDPVSGKQVCGLCGSDELDQGYGLGSGGGMGSYTFCCGCNHFLDFVEDFDE